MASSQRRGERTNAVGAISTEVIPQYSGMITLPIRPMSWYRGTQFTAVVSGSKPKQPAAARALASRLPWLTITPLGLAVDPEVYCRKASESARALTGVQFSPVPGASLSRAASQRAWPSARAGPSSTPRPGTQRECGHGDHPGVQAAVEGDDIVQAGRAQDQDPVPGTPDRGEHGRGVPGAPVEVAVRDFADLGVGSPRVVKEAVGDTFRLVSGAQAQKFGDGPRRPGHGNLSRGQKPGSLQPVPTLGSLRLLRYQSVASGPRRITSLRRRATPGAR